MSPAELPRQAPTTALRNLKTSSAPVVHTPGAVELMGLLLELGVVEPRVHHVVAHYKALDDFTGLLNLTIPVP